MGHREPGLGQLGRFGLRRDVAGPKNAELAAKVAFGIYADDASLADGWQNQIIFPLNNAVLTSDEFVDAGGGILQRPAGQQGGLRSGSRHAYKGFTYSPFGSFYYASFTEAAGRDQRRREGWLPGSRRPADQKLVDYATEPGLHGQRIAYRACPGPLCPGPVRRPIHESKQGMLA